MIDTSALVTTVATPYITNNVVAGTQVDTSNNNQSNVDMNTVFVDFDGTGGYSTDGKWQLAPGSPALGAADDGGDCGIFGGQEPYVLSGLPRIPAIFFYRGPGTGNDAGLPVQIKIMSHN